MTLSVDQTRKIISATNAVLVAAVVIAGLVVARDAVILAGSGGQGVDKATEAESPAKGYSRTLAFRDYAPVVKNNVFGFDAGELAPISKASMAPQSTGESSPARVALQVFGTVAWDGGAGYAFIKGPKGKQSVVKTGEEIPGSGLLERVYPDMIVVSLQGREFEVETMQVSPARDKTTPEQGKAPGNGFARRTGAGEYVVDRIAVEDSISNPKRLLTDARMLPHFNEQRKQVGFSLSEVKPGGIYHTLGLKNKDVVLGVNGLELSDPESALAAFSALKGATRITVDILRNGQPQTLTYTLR
ncbi:MAG: hypothetical protein KAR83_06895 [Thermodesulfovibrionales bacterium]|nr:hypothetical protein [Thermodesulfovibrionales bacterium]